MSYEGNGMKLRDLARGSSNSTSPMPALHIFRRRFWNPETSRRSRKSYESVHKLSTALRLLTLLQQTTMVTVLGILRHPSHPGSRVALLIRAHRGDRNLHNRTCHRAPFLYSLIPQQSQREVYHEVLIAGDLSEEDVLRSGYIQVSWIPYGSASDTAQLVYGNDTIYFAQPSLSQLIPGGSGAGTFNQTALIVPEDTQNNALPLTGRAAPDGDTGVVLR